VVQVQQEFNRLNNSNLADDRKKLLGDTAFEQICQAAKYCGINFGQQTFTLGSLRTYSMEKTGAGVKSYKTVGG
jgi:hypothetical protein